LIDRAEIYVKGGDGGNGTVSFRREKFVPYGGPDGGDGGNGGSIYILGDAGAATLYSFRYKKQFRAEDGGKGKGKNMYGKRGDDLIIKVPLGTQVRLKKEDGEGGLVADVVEHGQQVLVAGGGKGGKGNARFATSTNQAPRTAEKGEPGVEAWLQLDLKLIADVGIVGYPNAGKSTLLSRVTKARPKIADYPFTTLEPVLGVVDMVDMGERSFVLADIPGIIEGAHLGRGLGLDFLRHIERTQVLIHLVDGGAENPLSEMGKVEAELGSYEPPLNDRPRVVAINKIDLPEVRSRLPQLEKEFMGLGIPVYYISAATGEGVRGLLLKALEMVVRSGKTGTEKKEEEEFKVFRPRPLPSRKGSKREGKHDQV
jgi:GTP-binding protein